VFFLFFVEYFVDTKSDSALVVWFLIFQILYEIFNAIILIPYQTWLIEVACNNNDYMRVVTTAIPLGMLIGGVVGLLLQLLGKPHILFYMYAVGGCASTIAICYFVPSKKMTSIPAQPPYIPSFQTCIRLQEFKLVFIITVLVNLINSVFSNATNTFMSCSYFDYLQIVGGVDDEAIKSRHQYAWIGNLHHHQYTSIIIITVIIFTTTTTPSSSSLSSNSWILDTGVFITVGLNFKLNIRILDAVLR